MSKIIVRSTTVTPREITTKNNTKMVFREQSAAIMKDGEDFPHPFRLTLDDVQAPYPAGEYQVDPSTFTVGRFDNLEIGRRVVLVPIMPAAVAPAAK
ncbi:single-stranded DNA-binding protein [Stenotrophomonas rhizophila]|uniref:single-stranded DNA-binding protein n=1 Tax=Stenotrophomonas rhizophila TaxID=216778 RepID=UPI0028A74040|nr:single-stranded DNA-binding protein [Stenotrophomonas rhizophila]